MQIIHTNNPENSSTGKNTYRDRIELLRSRVGLLTGKDRLLMTMYLENGNTFRQYSERKAGCGRIIVVLFRHCGHHYKWRQ